MYLGGKSPGAPERGSAPADACGCQAEMETCLQEECLPSLSTEASLLAAA